MYIAEQLNTILATWEATDDDDNRLPSIALHLFIDGLPSVQYAGTRMHTTTTLTRLSGTVLAALDMERVGEVLADPAGLELRVGDEAVRRSLLEAVASVAAAAGAAVSERTVVADLTDADQVPPPLGRLVSQAQAVRSAMGSSNNTLSLVSIAPAGGAPRLPSLPGVNTLGDPGSLAPLTDTLPTVAARVRLLVNGLARVAWTRREQERVKLAGSGVPRPLGRHLDLAPRQAAVQAFLSTWLRRLHPLAPPSVPLPLPLPLAPSSPMSSLLVGTLERTLELVLREPLDTPRLLSQCAHALDSLRTSGVEVHRGPAFLPVTLYVSPDRGVVPLLSLLVAAGCVVATVTTMRRRTTRRRAAATS